MNFARYPQSITELRASETNDAREWTPRDVLIDVLRKLDAGEIHPDHLVVCWYKEALGEDEEELTPGWRMAYRKQATLAGMVAMLARVVGES